MAEYARKHAAVLGAVCRRTNWREDNIPLMQGQAFDIAVFGSNPLASLLAGLLASAHGKKVCLLSMNDWEFRLPTGLDLSIAPMTRPETWAIHEKVMPETIKLLARIGGKTACSRIDPLFIADTQAGSAALSHMHYMALAFGYAMEKTTQNGGRKSPQTAYRVRDAVVLSRTQLARPMARWLEKAGVHATSSKDVTIRADGSASIITADAAIEAKQVVMADDASMLAFLDGELMRAFSVEDATSLLTEVVADAIASASVYVDRGIVLNQRPGGGITVLAAGKASDALPRIGASLEGLAKLRRAGERSFRKLRTADGAPVVGALRGSGVFVLAELGLSGAFLAPAIARFVAGAASADEAAYFIARAPRNEARLEIAEYRPAVFGETGA